jgi:general secretion pathway protein A
MYEGFYRLTDKPFKLSPDYRFYFESRGHRRAMAYLRYGLEQREGFIVVTGGVGTGKTTLIETLVDQISHQGIATAKIASTHLEADDLLRMVSAAFGLSHTGLNKAELLGNLETFLRRKSSRRERTLLIIDEAQNIPQRSLEELRMLSNLQVDGRMGLQTFLLGQDEFLQVLRLPNMEQLRQRVIATYRLGALEQEETRDYIEHRLALVGWQNDPEISPDAYEQIHLQTGGVPRRINTFCDRLLLYGYLEEVHAFTAETVKQVAEELNSELDRSAVAVQMDLDTSRVRLIEGRIDELEERVKELEDALILERARLRAITINKAPA